MMYVRSVHLTCTYVCRTAIVSCCRCTGIKFVGRVSLHFREKAHEVRAYVRTPTVYDYGTYVVTTYVPYQGYDAEAQASGGYTYMRTRMSYMRLVLT
jgi:hypothetical protein